MIEKARIILFYIFLSLLLIIEGWGVSGGKQISFYLILVTPFILFSTYFFEKKRIEVPYTISILFILFSICIFVSTIFSIHKQYAFEYQLYYLSISLICIFVLNNADALKKIFKWFVLWSSLATLLYSLFLQFLLPESLAFLIPYYPSQFVYKFDGHMNHYPIGAFALIPWSFAFIYFIFDKTFGKTVSIILLSAVILLSSLRSAYISILAVLLITFRYWKDTVLRKKSEVPLLLFICILLFSVILTSRTSFQIPGVTAVHNYLAEHGAAFKYRSLINSRDKYFAQAWKGFINRPLVGYGSRNFYFVSMLYQETIEDLTTNSHNLLLDIAVEHGFPGLVIFIGILYLYLKNIHTVLKGKNKEDMSIAIMFISLLLLFQFNFYSRIYFVFVLLFISGALLYKEKKILKDSHILHLISAAILVISTFMISSKIALSQGNYVRALQMYPLSEVAYRQYIQELSEEKKIDQMVQIIEQYIEVYPKNPESLIFVADTYLNLQHYEQAAFYYEKALPLFPHEPDLILANYEIIKKTQSKEHADLLISKHIRDNNVLGYGSQELRLIYRLCEREKLLCNNY